MFAAASVTTRRLVSRVAVIAPCGGTNGRNRFSTSVALVNCSGMSWVITSSPGTPASSWGPTMVRVDVWTAPSLGMIRQTLPDFTAARPLTSRIVRRTGKMSSTGMRPVVWTVTFLPRAPGAKT